MEIVGLKERDNCLMSLILNAFTIFVIYLYKIRQNYRITKFLGTFFEDFNVYN